MVRAYGFGLHRFTSLGAQGPAHLLNKIFYAPSVRLLRLYAPWLCMARRHVLADKTAVRGLCC